MNHNKFLKVNSKIFQSQRDKLRDNFYIYKEPIDDNKNLIKRDKRVSCCECYLMN